MKSDDHQSDNRVLRAYFQRHPVRHWLLLYSGAFAFTSAIYDLEDHLGLFKAGLPTLPKRYVFAAAAASGALAAVRWQFSRQTRSKSAPDHAPVA